MNPVYYKNIYSFEPTVLKWVSDDELYSTTKLATGRSLYWVRCTGKNIGKFIRTYKGYEEIPMDDVRSYMDSKKFLDSI